MTVRNYNIDFIKALAIISVILIHGLSNDTLYAILAPYYIWQTVPVFMILLGYNSANSFTKRGYERLSEIYNQQYLLKKAKRILLPFTLIWFAQILIQFFYFDKTNIVDLLTSFFVGGYGPGSYFIPVIVQATLLAPILYLILKKQPTKMMIILFFVSILIDLATYWLDISGSLYRLLIIRHIFSVTLGVWFSLVKTRITFNWLLLPAALSFGYITAVHYFNYELVIEEYWHSQHAPAYFYVLLLIILGMKFFNIKKESVLEKSFILIGEASFHIFLTQMFYFWFISRWLPDLNGIVYIMLFLTVPILSGIGFYYLDNYLNRKLSDATK
ncbi:acyltransferase family protein [Alkalibacterium sp. f15]|uniref:acyltransferase family protein n=1 Tax=Alkalibacterium sp. f15 TaxID=3414029 RepID=UPI003BF8587A